MTILPTDAIEECIAFRNCEYNDTDKLAATAYKQLESLKAESEGLRALKEIWRSRAEAYGYAISEREPT